MLALTVKLLLELLNAFNAVADSGERAVQFGGWLRKRPPLVRGSILIGLLALVLVGVAFARGLRHGPERIASLPAVQAVNPEPVGGTESESTQTSAGAPHSEVPPHKRDGARVGDARPEILPPVLERTPPAHQTFIDETDASGALPGSVYAMLSEGQSLHHQGDYRGAGKLYRDALAQIPSGSSSGEAVRRRAELVALIRDARSGCENDPEASC